MKATVLMTHHNPPVIRRASPKRDWMDETYNRHAYACLPVTSANISGWELILQKDVVVEYDGSIQPPRILSDKTMTFVAPDGTEYTRDIANSTITGVLSFPTAWAFNLPEHHALWVTGSPNYFVDGAAPLSGSIPYWWPEDFNMNWKITKINEPVTFKAGEPFMFFQIYDTRIMPSIDFEVKTAWGENSITDTPDSRWFERLEYKAFKEQQRVDAPWKWLGTMRTGLDHKGRRIGPKHKNPQPLKEPQWKTEAE